MFSRKRADSANNTVLLPPPPRVVQPTGDFLGNDGEWSTFWINVGDSEGTGGGQNFKVLISTSSPLTLVPGQSEWCDPACAHDRGVQPYNGDQSLGLQMSSRTWQLSGTYDLPLPYWWFNKKNTPGGIFGLENVGINPSSNDSDSVVLKKMYVAGTTSKDFYMGQFGLAAGALNPGGGLGSVRNFITAIAGGSQIPSISYGYTAGAKYRNSNNGVVGNLVLGGYDSTRLNMQNSVSIAMPNSGNNSLVVGVRSISYQPDPYVEANLFSFTDKIKGGFSAVIDSTLPYLWLPDEVVDHFVEKFNLKYDKNTDLYTINSTAAAANRQQNATVLFKIGQGAVDSPDFATISLPHSAFDLTFTAPPNGNGTAYFPIKKSPTGIFVLGRSFLQEAYIIVDYERANFTVAAALSPAPLPEAKLVSIYNTTYHPPGPTPTPESGGGGPSGGAIAGIVVAIVVLFFGVALTFFFWWKKRRAARNAPPGYKEATEIDTSAAGNEVKHRRVSELDSQPPGAPKSAGPGGFYGGRDGKDPSPFPAISEMDSPPAELYSPPAVASTHSEGTGTDYFTAGGARLERRGATRESSANNTPGTEPSFTPIAELPGDDGKFQVNGMHFDPIPSPKGSPVLKSGSIHNRGPSETASLQNRIDEVMKRPSAEPSPARPARTEADTEDTASETTRTEKERKADAEDDAAGEESLERRPSHTRGLSDTTVQSDTTVVSQPTPEELERWALAEDEQPRRPLSE